MDPSRASPSCPRPAQVRLPRTTADSFDTWNLGRVRSSARRRDRIRYERADNTPRSTKWWKLLALSRPFVRFGERGERETASNIDIGCTEADNRLGGE